MLRLSGTKHHHADFAREISQAISPGIASVNATYTFDPAHPSTVPGIDGAARLVQRAPVSLCPLDVQVAYLRHPAHESLVPMWVGG